MGWQLYERTGSKLALGLVGLVEVVPLVLLSVPAGLAADRFPRAGLAIVSHVVMSAVCVGLALVTWSHAPVWCYYVLLAIKGAAMAFRAASVGTLVPLLVPPSDFANVNAWLSSTFQLAAMTGPPAAGLLLAATGDAVLAFAGAAVAHLLFVLALFRLPKLRQVAAAGARGWRSLFSGLGFIVRNRPFFAAVTLDMVAVLLAGAEALMPVFAKDVLHVGPEGLGILRAAPALGAFSMAVLQTRLAPWQRPGIAMLVTVAGFGVATVGFGLSTSLWLSAAMLFFCGVFDNVSVVIRSTMEQAMTPDSMRGRVSAMHAVFISISNELGAFESGALAALLGPLGAVVTGGVGCLLVVALYLRVFPQLKTLPPLHKLQPVEP